MMTPDTRDALARLVHSLENSPQASQLSDADARTASALAQGRIAELEEQVVRERARADALTKAAAPIIRRLGASPYVLVDRRAIEALQEACE